MLLKIAAVLAAIPLALMGLFGATGILWVDVQEGGASGHHIVVPVPLLAVQAAAAFVPPHVAREMQLPPEALEALPAAERALEALATTSQFFIDALLGPPSGGDCAASLVVSMPVTLSASKECPPATADPEPRSLDLRARRHRRARRAAPAAPGRASAAVRRW